MNSIGESIFQSELADINLLNLLNYFVKVNRLKLVATDEQRVWADEADFSPLSKLISDVISPVSIKSRLTEVLKNLNLLTNKLFLIPSTDNRLLISLIPLLLQKDKFNSEVRTATLSDDFKLLFIV